MVASAGLDRAALALQHTAAGHERRFERIKIREGAVGDRLVHQPPQPLGRLQLGGGRGQEGEVDPRWQHQLLGGVPASLVEHQHRPLRRPNPFVAGEFGQGQAKRLC